MNENKKVFSYNFAGKDVTIETGRMAKQADGSVLVSCNGTQVLVTVCSALEVKDGQDFFPLTVEYTEKLYAAGKFLGGYKKREMRPSVQETLAARLIDRPLRPLFPEGYMFDTVVQATVLSYTDEGDAEVLAGIGASAALSFSNIPFSGPTASCKVGRIDGKFVLNPNFSEWEKSDAEIAVAATKDAILMVEGECKELTEAEMVEALELAHNAIKGFCLEIEKMAATLNVKKRVFVPATPNKAFMSKVAELFSAEAKTALAINPKLERQTAVAALISHVAEKIKSDPAMFGFEADVSAKKEAAKAVDELLYKIMRADILDNEKRIGGRNLTTVRPIETEIDVLAIPHGSALFTRGETQVLGVATLGGSDGDEKNDRISGLITDKFYLHYNFPPFSVGEAKTPRGTGRRELGHGNLAFRAIKGVYPFDFPYTARVVCEVLESNGSSSMGSVCAGCLALFDAGVPLKKPVAGVAMGLISDGSRFKILTDILGDEDHLGDMDFKVAGSADGITAIQMDIKITGITKEIITKALAQAHAGRLHILGEMAKTMSAPRLEYKKGVPRIETLTIPTDKIGALIGPGGKNIRALQADFGVTIECDEQGLVKVIGPDREKLKECASLIDMQINGPELGANYQAVVVSIKEYGAFVDIAPGISGLVHVSEMSDDRVVDVNDYVSEGDLIDVQVVEFDKMGRMKLSAKAVKSLTKKAK